MPEVDKSPNDQVILRYCKLGKGSTIENPVTDIPASISLGWQGESKTLAPGEEWRISRLGAEKHLSNCKTLWEHKGMVEIVELAAQEAVGAVAAPLSKDDLMAQAAAMGLVLSPAAQAPVAPAASDAAPTDKKTVRQNNVDLATSLGIANADKMSNPDLNAAIAAAQAPVAPAPVA